MSLAFALLVAALAVFWLSTRQFKQPWRSLIWLVGAVLVAAAIANRVAPEFGIWSAISDLWQHRNAPNEIAIYRALILNGPGVAPFLGQQFDFFVVATVLLGALALLAFTRGDKLERFIRPAILSLLAFIAGGAATLAVVAIGFGGYSKPRTFTSLGHIVRVHDGDTFWIGENSMRLYGVDAPENDQQCYDRVDVNCGAAARAYLDALLSRGTLQCDQMLSRQSQRPRDSFGRALVKCWMTESGGRRYDLGEELVRAGYAVQYQGGDYGYNVAAALARQAKAGLLNGCWLRPDVIRSRQRQHQQAREAFARREQPSQDSLTVGDCASLRAVPQSGGSPP